jgi:hypothetical protein
MNKLIGGLALVFMVSANSTGAQAAAWCAYYDFSTYNCGFHTYQQCLATISGVGGYCSPNRYQGYGGNPQPARRKARQRY